MRELIARCKALLRRVERAKVIAKNSENEKILNFGSLVIDPAQRLVTVNGEQVHLTRPSSTCWSRSRANPSRCSPARSCSKRSGTGWMHPAPAPSTPMSRRCVISSVPRPSEPCTASATLSSRRNSDEAASEVGQETGPIGFRSSDRAVFVPENGIERPDRHRHVHRVRAGLVPAQVRVERLDRHAADHDRRTGHHLFLLTGSDRAAEAAA